jgi:anti-sigma B factor antagonist
VALAMEMLDLTTETDGSTIRLALGGELDIASARQVEQELERIEQQGPATVILDLRQLTFMDSTGLRILVAADGRAREQGRRLVVVRGPEAVQRIFHMTRIDERLEIVDDLAAVHAG